MQGVPGAWPGLRWAAAAGVCSDPSVACSLINDVSVCLCLSVAH